MSQRNRAQCVALQTGDWVLRAPASTTGSQEVGVGLQASQSSTREPPAGLSVLNHCSLSFPAPPKPASALLRLSTCIWTLPAPTGWPLPVA